MYYLARHPIVQSKLRKELDAVFPSDSSDDPVLPYDALKHLPYLDAILNEVLRIHATNATGLPRYVPAGGLVVCGQSFAEGTVLSVPVLALHRASKWWGDDADEFRPERWLERERAELQRAFIPFGFGPR